MDRHYRTIERAIAFIEQSVEDQPELAEIAATAGLSPERFQRVFSSLAGVSPKKFLQYLTLGRAKQALDASASVLDASFEAGLSGPGRLHDLFVAFEAATPGEYKARGAGMEIRHGIGDSPFGPVLLLWSDRGITGLAFVEGVEADAMFRELAAPYQAARFVADPAGAKALSDTIFQRRPAGAEPLRLFVAGTPFQAKVWEALLRIPAGGVASYEDVARMVGSPGASRAVGNAVASNLIGYLIPCHRVIRRTGAFGNYRWGPECKSLILGYEAAKAEQARAA